MESLDLYAKIEPMIGFYEAYDKLYRNYLQLLEAYRAETVLDVGCGNGRLLQKLQEAGYRASGIDISPKMVEIACEKGVDARCCRLDEVDAVFDTVLAVADVLNYLDPSQLQPFMEDVAGRLKEGGYFLCDINTWHGFADVAAGSMTVDEESGFLAIDAEFEEGILQTEFTYFQKREACYLKEQATILQYFHKVDEIVAHSPMRLVGMHDISLFSTESDKTVLVFQK